MFVNQVGWGDKNLSYCVTTHTLVGSVHSDPNRKRKLHFFFLQKKRKEQLGVKNHGNASIHGNINFLISKQSETEKTIPS